MLRKNARIELKQLIVFLKKKKLSYLYANELRPFANLVTGVNRTTYCLMN